MCVCVRMVTFRWLTPVFFKPFQVYLNLSISVDHQIYHIQVKLGILKPLYVNCTSKRCTCSLRGYRWWWKELHVGVDVPTSYLGPLDCLVSHGRPEGEIPITVTGYCSICVCPQIKAIKMHLFSLYTFGYSPLRSVPSINGAPLIGEESPWISSIPNWSDHLNLILINICCFDIIGK